MDADTTPIVEPPSLRCTAGRFRSLEAALQWALTTADERFAPDGVERLEISRYWAYPDGVNEGIPFFDVAVNGHPA